MYGYSVYIMANRRHGTLYIGVTNNLARRVHEHRSGDVPGFTDRYDVKCLVWFEMHDSIETAIQREKSLKRWYRRWKIDLVEKANPGWRDLFPEIST